MTNWGTVGVIDEKVSTLTLPDPSGGPKVDYGATGVPDEFMQRNSAWGWFALGVEDQFGSTSGNRVDWLSDTIKMAIVNAQPNQDTAQYWSGISGTEVSGTGYTAGGATLASKTLTYDSATQRVKLGCADVTWTTVSFTAGLYAVIYKDTGSAATSPLIACLDLQGAWTPVAQDFTVTLGGTALYAVV